MTAASRFFLAGLLTAACLPALAQRPLLSTDVAADTARQQYGPNRRHFRHLYLAYLPVLGQPQQPGAELRPWASAEFVLGLREKLRLAEHLAVGADLRYVRLQYSLAQNDEKLLPTPEQHYRETLVLHQAVLEGWLRVNAGRRGNAVGNYVDLAAWGGWAIGTAHHTQDRPNGPRAKRVNTSEHGLPYVRRWSYGLGARLGSQRYAAVVRYRLSDTFRGAEAAQFPELPRWHAGVEIGLL